MDELIKEENNTQSGLSFQEQQQAYIEAIRQVEKENKQAKKKKRLIKLGVAVAIIALVFIGKSISDFVTRADKISEVANLHKYLPASSNEYVDTYKTDIENAVKDYIRDEDPNDEKIQKTLIEQAQLAMDNGSYYGASIILEHCSGNENAKGIINECNYQLVIACINDDQNGTAWLICQELDNYKNSDALEIWLHFINLLEVQQALVKSAVQENCKDPSSFREEYGGKCYFDVFEDETSETGYSVSLEIEIAYSATNSYGGRVRDSYSHKFEPFDFEIYGKSIDEVKRIVELSKTDILSESK